MKFGLNSAILGHMSLEEMIPFIAKIGYQSVEVACWPQGKAERRYAGVSHIDVDTLTDDKVIAILGLCKEYNIEISSLAYYPNPLDSNPEARSTSINHLLKVIDASSKLGVNMVTTFIGRMQEKNVEDNLEEVAKVWPEIIQYAKEKNVKIAIENCPMLFTNDEWPGGKNLFTSPAIWKKVFKILPYDNFGINFDPSHFIWQQMDYIKPIFEFKEKMFHIHFKDIQIDYGALDNYGVMANPLNYMSPKLPGLGDVDWGRYVSALNSIGYKGHACVEIEDKSFEETEEDIEKSVILSYRYLSQFII